MYAATATAQTPDMYTLALLSAEGKAHRPVQIAMPMITVHWIQGAWTECHHGALRKRLPLKCQANGFSDRVYPAAMTPAQVLIAVRDANPGCDVQLIPTALQSNEFVLFPKRNRRAN